MTEAFGVPEALPGSKAEPRKIKKKEIWNFGNLKIFFFLDAVRSSAKFGDRMLRIAWQFWKCV